MKRMATGMLVVMAGIYLVARLFVDLHPAIGFVKAFAEAAMVGGLIVSTILTLLIVPASFSLAVGAEARVGPWLSYWLTTGGDGEQPSRPPRLLAKGFWRRLGGRFRRRPDDAIQPAE